MPELQIQSESLPQRCEICHQSDLFDPQNGHCSRCAGIKIPQQVLPGPSIQRRNRGSDYNREHNLWLLKTVGVVGVVIVIAIFLPIFIALIKFGIGDRIEHFRPVVPGITPSFDGKYFAYYQPEPQQQPEKIDILRQGERKGHSLMLYSQSRLEKILFSPDSKVLAAVSHNSISLWKVAEGEQICKIPALDANDIAFSNDGQLLAVDDIEDANSYTGKRWIKIYDTSGQLLQIIADSFPVAFSPDKHLLATGGSKNVKLWEIGKSSPIDKIEINSLLAHLDFSLDGKLLAIVRSGPADKELRNIFQSNIQFWDIKDKEVVADTGMLTGKADLILFTNGKGFATVSDYTISSWHLSSGRLTPDRIIEKSKTNGYPFVSNTGEIYSIDGIDPIRPLKIK